MEQPSHQQPRHPRDAQTAAVLASSAIILGFAIYWTIQIQAVRDMLALAYG